MPEFVESLPVLELREEVRIGSLDDPDTGFSRIGPVDVGADGTIYVVESQDREVRGYSPDGRLLRRIGGAGEGPGEFGAAPSRMGVRGDTIWVTDMRLLRVTLFTTEGAFLATLPVPPTTGLVRMPEGVVPISPADGSVEVARSALAGPESAFGITRTSEAGDTIYSRTFGYSPVPFPSSLVDSLVAARGPLDFPPHQPAVADLFAGTDGTLVLRREWHTAGDPRWLVIAPDGEPVGHLSLPATSALRWVGGDRLYVVEPDEVGVPWLVGYGFATRTREG